MPWNISHLGINIILWSLLEEKNRKICVYSWHIEINKYFYEVWEKTRLWKYFTSYVKVIYIYFQKHKNIEAKLFSKASLTGTDPLWVQRISSSPWIIQEILIFSKALGLLSYLLHTYLFKIFMDKSSFKYLWKEKQSSHLHGSRGYISHGRQWKKYQASGPNTPCIHPLYLQQGFCDFSWDSC